MDSELNDQQKTFCREYVADIKRNARRAYIRAGYAEKGARSAGPLLLKDPRVQEFIAELDAERIEQLDIGPDEVVKMLVASYDRATAAGQHNAAAKCAELLGKVHGMFKDSFNVKTEPEEMSVEELCTVNGQVVPEAVKLVSRAFEILEEFERRGTLRPPSPSTPQDEKPNLEGVK